MSRMRELLEEGGIELVYTRAGAVHPRRCIIVADANAFPHGSTALCEATKRNQVDSVTFLLTVPGIDVSVVRHLSSVSFSSSQGTWGMAPARVHVQVNLGATPPLHRAAKKGNVAIVKMFLARDDVEIDKVEDTDVSFPFTTSRANDRYQTAHVRRETPRSTRRHDTADLPSLSSCSRKAAMPTSRTM